MRNHWKTALICYCAEQRMLGQSDVLLATIQHVVLEDLEEGDSPLTTWPEVLMSCLAFAPYSIKNYPRQ